jgi:hypothetical protein
MLDFMIIINDDGELKTVNAKELRAIGFAYGDVLDMALNAVLDKYAEDAGTYTPADNDTPMILTAGED